MADKNVADHKYVSPMFHNAITLIRAIYDFALDTGESDDDYMLITAGSDDVVIHGYWVRGITLFDSAGDGTTVDVGVDGGDEDILMDGIVEASFAADALLQATIVEGAPNVMPMPLILPANTAIRMKFAVEDLTSGKAEFNFLVSKYK